MATIARKSSFNFKWSKFFTSWYHPFVVFALILTLFFLLRLGGGNEPILLKLGPFQFRWYGVIITTGVIIAAFLAQFLATRRGDNPDHVWRILPVVLVSGILVARVWYVVSTWESYKDYFFSVGNPQHAGFIEIWRGGIAIQGAVVGGTIGTYLYGLWVNRTQRTSGPRFSIWRWADYIAPGLVLAQAFGRWGNFMNNEAYGRPTGMPWGIQIPCDYRTTGLTPGTDNTACTVYGKDTLFHPTFLYESLWDYLCFAVLFWLIMKPKTFERRFHFKLRDGDIFLVYWVIYSIGRFFTESLRTDSLYIGGNVGGLRTAQVTAIAGILIASLVLFLRHRKSFPAPQALSARLTPVAASANIAAATAVAEAPIRPDYKARVRPVTATDEDLNTETSDASIGGADGEENLETFEPENKLADISTENEANADEPEAASEPLGQVEEANILNQPVPEFEPVAETETAAPTATIVEAGSMQDTTTSAGLEVTEPPIETVAPAVTESAVISQPKTVVPTQNQPKPKTPASNGASNKRKTGRR